MPRHGDVTRRLIINAAYELFYRDGFANAGIDAVAEATGVTKRTIYYHFDSKQTLIAAVLDVQHELMLELIQSWADRVADDPVHLVEKLFAEFAAWAKQSRWRGSGFTRAAMEFAGSPGHPARKAARRHKASVEGWLAQQFAQGGVSESQLLARKVMLLLEGCHSLVLIHGESNYADAASEAASLIVKAAIGRYE